MKNANFIKWLTIFGLAASIGTVKMSASDSCSAEDGSCGREREAPRHVHFSNKDFDLYEANEDAVYHDADWPSRVEEYSDYLSK